MNLDTFIISILFNDTATKNSAKKVEGVVNDLAKSIVKTFTAIASVDFLKDSVERVTELATKLENLAFITGVNQEQIGAWGEAVKRAGGTIGGFESSITSLSAKIREMQTNFGSAGQLSLTRMGISLKNNNGQIKNAIDILSELSTKFQSLPKVWQLKIGQDLGLDNATIKLLGQGNVEVAKIVEGMKHLGDFNSVNLQKTIAFRNKVYDLKLSFTSLSNVIVANLLPPLTAFTDIATKFVRFVKDRPHLIRAGMLALATVITSLLIPAFLSLARISAPFLALGAVIVGIGLVIEDLIVWLNGGNSALGKYFQAIANGTKGIREFITQHQDFFITFAKISGVVIATIIGFKSFIGVIKMVIPVITALRVAMFALATNPVVLALTAIITATSLLITNWENVVKWMRIFGNEADKIYNKISGTMDKIRGRGVAIQQAVNTVYTDTKRSIISTIHNVSQKLGFDSNKAATIAKIESNFNPNARARGSSASGVFQLIDSTAKENGITDLSQKNNPRNNIIAGINNLKKTSEALSLFLHREPTGAELYLGEMLGIAGSKRVLGANANSPLASLLAPNAMRSNPSFQGLTAGQLRNRAETTYRNNQVSVGAVNVNASGSDSGEIARNIRGELSRQFSSLVTNNDSGLLL